MCIYVACSAFNHPGAAMQVVCPALTTVTWETGIWAIESSPCLMGYSWVGHIVRGFNMAFLYPLELTVSTVPTLSYLL